MSTLWSNAYGVCIRTSLSLPGLRPVAGRPDGGELVLEWADVDAIRRAFSGPAGPSWSTRTPSGRRHRLQKGKGGDHLITWDDDSAFLLAEDGCRLLCGGPDAADPAWQRFLLDTVLAYASLARGIEAVHGSALRIRDGAVIVLGQSGAGKSSLAAEVLRGGARIVADDVVALSRTAAGVVAHPAPAVMNLPSGPVPNPLRLASIDGEDWVAVPGAALEPIPVRAVVLLRAGERGRELSPLPANPVPLLRHAFGLRWFPERAVQRLDLFSALAEQAPIYELDRGSASPARLARVLLWSHLARPADVRGAA